jgi:GNAT superfamily N-acetyltransferase
MKSTVRIAMARDLGKLVDLEIKCQEYCYNLEELKDFVNDKEYIAFIASIGNRDVGYSLCMLKDQRLGATIGVHPDFRNLGVSKSLMSKVSKHAMSLNCHALQFCVPSYKIDDPTDPDYLGWWFESMELKAGRVITDYFYRYGKAWDAYIFEALV